MNGKSYPVVVGVDGSFAAIRAGRWAAAVAEEFGAPLQILHLKPDRTSSDAIADPTAAEMAARRESAEAIVQAAEQACEPISRACTSPAPRWLVLPAKHWSSRAVSHD